MLIELRPERPLKNARDFSHTNETYYCMAFKNHGQNISRVSGRLLLAFRVIKRVNLTGKPFTDRLDVSVELREIR